MTKIELELIPDADMYIFFEKSTRGGISYIFKRYSKGNNKHFKSCSPNGKPKHIIYWEANNLYGYAMSKFFPKSG